MEAWVSDQPIMVDAGLDVEVRTGSQHIKEEPSSLLGVDEVPSNAKLVMDARRVSLEGANILVIVVSLYNEASTVMGILNSMVEGSTKVVTNKVRSLAIGEDERC